MNGILYLDNASYFQITFLLNLWLEDHKISTCMGLFIWNYLSIGKPYSIMTSKHNAEGVILSYNSVGELLV